MSVCWLWNIELKKKKAYGRVETHVYKWQLATRCTQNVHDQQQKRQQR